MVAQLNRDKEKEISAPTTRWARDYDACKVCHTTEHHHKGRGLCMACYYQKYRLQNTPKTTDGYDEGYQDGVQDAVYAVNRIVDRIGSSCWLRNGTIYLKNGDQTLKEKVK